MAQKRTMSTASLLLAGSLVVPLRSSAQNAKSAETRRVNGCFGEVYNERFDSFKKADNCISSLLAFRIQWATLPKANRPLHEARYLENEPC